MDHYAGIDVSLECSSVCVVDAKGKIVREAKVASEPEALIDWFHSLGFDLARIGLPLRPVIGEELRRLRVAGLRVILDAVEGRVHHAFHLGVRNVLEHGRRGRDRNDLFRFRRRLERLRRWEQLAPGIEIPPSCAGFRRAGCE